MCIRDRLYTQLFQMLYYQADIMHGGELPVPVHFMMDEFANVALPDEFDKLLSTMRSRQIFVSIIIQNLAQIKALYLSLIHIFTSHNLRALEKLSYKSIIVTTANTNNRYIQLTGIKSNNNVRDYYYTNILLGGQCEPIYEETKNFKIKRAFRKAGSFNE